MKTTYHNRSHRPTSASRDGGAVIIVVMSLLTTLLFLGLFFYNWSTQEMASARYFSESSLSVSNRIDPVPLFDAAAEQLIVGTSSDHRYSVLWGGMHSMLAHEIGRIDENLQLTDSSVGNGTGIVIRFTDSGGDGYPDVNGAGGFDDADDFQFIYNDGTNGSSGNVVRNINNFQLNYSRLAQTDKSADAFNQSTNSLPYYRPDCGYTYPDVNSLFLAHEELVTDPSNPSEEHRVLIPSFFRPQLFPAYRSTNGTGSYLPLYTSSTPEAQVFHPHRQHKYANGDERYLSTTTTAQSGDLTRSIEPFPFPNTGEMGVFTDVTSSATSSDYSFLDVDLDGDGVKDAIWMDLDLPMVELDDGQQYMPLASFKVIDADGLLNLNVHGNLQGYARLGRMPNADEPVSVSNLGMSRSEVNPLWALMNNPSSLTAPELSNVIDRFSTAPGSAMQLANMEWLMLLQGWAPTGGEKEVLGRYGERDRLTMGLSPLAGQATVDDDGDNSTFGQRELLNANLPVSPYNDLPVPRFSHPLSPIGLGLPTFSASQSDFTNYVKYVTGFGAQRTLVQLDTNNPAVWPGYQYFQGLMSSGGLDLDYPTSLQDTPTADTLQDEDDETIVESGNSQFGLYDEPYMASDNAFLQLSDGDQYRAGVSSRLGTLAAANFQYLTNAAEIRKRFTTDSWDRLEFNFAPGIDREWEWGNGVKPTFPPEFTIVGGQVQPFRQELRDLFQTEFEAQNDFGSNRVSPRHRLNINRILSDDTLSGGAQSAFDGTNPNYRHLVPHPVALSGDKSVLDIPMYHGNSGVTAVDARLAFPNISSDAYVQEWWARYDRQRLARDIYCLLWVLGAPSDSVNALPFTAAQAREMAQFAVNVVDAIDRDNVITAFEYDPVLIDGWDTNRSNLEVVYGIEHQELAFNEVLFIKQTKENDDTATEYDDDAGSDATDSGYYFSFVELRNAAPWAVPIDDGTWRIRRVRNDSSEATLSTATLLRTGTPLQPVPDTVDAGGELLISCQSGDNRYGAMGDGNYRPSDFRVDYDGNGTYDAIVPNIIETIVPSDSTPEADRHPLCDLDLVHSDHAGCTEETFSPTTTLLNRTNHHNETDVLLVLERRLRPDPNAGTGSELSESVNPWVEVDRIEGTVRTFVASKLGAPDDSLNDMKSQERRTPYDSGTNITYPDRIPLDYDGPAAATDGLHTMPFLTKAAAGSGIRRNNRAPAQYTIWQPHFDRDLSSAMELLSIPLYGYYVAGASGSPWQAPIFGGATCNLAHPGATLTMNGHRTAGIRMLFPQDDAASGDVPSWFPGFTGDAAHYQNRWYRLLELVDVKSQNDLRMDEITAVQRRTPGKINLNTVRHESVFAGLVDDPFHLDPRSQNPMTRDRLETSRVWYLEHRLLRDGPDPLLATTSYPNITIPGGFNARPFRPLSFLEQPVIGDANSSDLSLQSTILRQRDPSTGQGLYEARTSSDVGNDTIDYHTRQRILAKIANNSTTRSHVFFVWIGLDFFEAHVNSNGNVQMGAQADPEVAPPYRMFCVVDMSRLEEAYNPLTGSFDFEKFIIHQQILP